MMDDKNKLITGLINGRIFVRDTDDSRLIALITERIMDDLVDCLITSLIN